MQLKIIAKSSQNHRKIIAMIFGKSTRLDWILRFWGESCDLGLDFKVWGQILWFHGVVCMCVYLLPLGSLRARLPTALWLPTAPWLPTAHRLPTALWLPTGPCAAYWPWLPTALQLPTGPGCLLALGCLLAPGCMHPHQAGDLLVDLGQAGLQLRQVLQLLLQVLTTSVLTYVHVCAGMHYMPYP